MDIKPYVDFATTHAPMFFAGAILTRPVLAADLAFKAVINTPAKRIIVWNWPTISKWIDQVQEHRCRDPLRGRGRFVHGVDRRVAV